MQGEPRLCQPFVLRSGIQGHMSARAMRAPLAPASSVDRHLYLLGVEQFDTANALQPYSRGRPAAYVDTVTAATCESGFEGNGWVWGDRIILGLIIPGVHRNSGHHHLVGLQQAKSS